MSFVVEHESAESWGEFLEGLPSREKPRRLHVAPVCKHAPGGESVLFSLRGVAFVRSVAHVFKEPSGEALACDHDRVADLSRRLARAHAVLCEALIVQGWTVYGGFLNEGRQ